MKNILELCGSWNLLCENSPTGDFEMQARVPGCIHTDLIENGVISDIFYRDNARNIQWIENCDLTYTKTFFVDSVFSDAYLEFDGIDTYADVYLNGVLLSGVDDMFTPYAFCVDNILRAGENTVKVKIFSPIKRVEGLPLHKGAFTRERMNTRRMQCTYGWDWVDRFVTMGIYRPVRLCFREKNEISSVYAYTESADANSAAISVEVSIRDLCDNGDTVKITLTDPDGNTVASIEKAIQGDKLCERIAIPSPKLWYPVGYGAQPLYALSVSTPSSTHTEKIGVRHVEILQEEDGEGTTYRELTLDLQSKAHLKNIDNNKTGESFAVTVNGVKIMCKGGNWVPCEPFPSAEAPEKITRLLELAVMGGVNTVRVWGGGIFERDEFYSECDRLGILVTQDFLMACGNYPEDEEWFISALNQEARATALRLRNHPCLVFWCGDNENAVNGTEDTTDFTGYRAATFGIKPILEELDPHRTFLLSSPWGGDRFCSSTRGTTHVTNYLGPIFEYINTTDMKDYREFFDGFYSRFCCEFPIFGMSFVSSLEKYLTHADIFEDDSLAMLEEHTKNNPAFSKTLFRIYLDAARKVFGDFTSGKDRILKFQMLECDQIRTSLELYRRRKGYSQGIIYWMLNDCWPAAAGWSILDYYACPKPAYYAFARSAKPVIASISKSEEAFEVHVCNDMLTDARGNGRIYVYDCKREIELLSESFEFCVRENESRKVFALDRSLVQKYLSDDCVIICDVHTDMGDDRAIFVENRFADLGIEYATPTVVSENEHEITVTADRFTPYAIIDSPYLLSENCFTLKAGETKTVRKLLPL